MYIFSPDKYQRDFKTLDEVATYLYYGNKPLIGHLSIGTYGDDAVQYKATHDGSMSGYSGVLMGEVIPIDIDLNMDKVLQDSKNNDITIEESFSKALKNTMLTLSPILSEWDNEGVIYHYFFSGNKGFSIYINKEYFAGIERFEGNFSNLCKSAVLSLKKKYPTLSSELFVIDTCPYHKVGMLRAPFTEHEKTKKVKYLLSPISKGNHGLMDCYNQIGKDWKKDKDLFHHILLRIYEPRQTEVKICYLEELFQTPEISKSQDYNKPYMMESCIWDIWKNGSSSTSGRQQTLSRLASWCAKKRFNAETTMNILTEANNNNTNKGPLHHSELLGIIKKYEKYYYNFCKDPICLEFCPKSKDCPYWDAAKATNRMKTPEESIEELELSDNADDSKAVRADSLFKGLKGVWNPKFGHIISLCGASGSGKTQVILQYMLKNNHINWIFWSYEQGVADLLDSCRTILGLTAQDDWKEILTEKTKHILFVRDGNICVQDIFILKTQFEQIHNKKFHAMAADYWGIIPVRNPENGKIINTESESIPMSAKAIKDNTITHEVIFLIAAQPVKEYSAYGAVLLEPEYVKFGQPIQSCSDFQITICRPNILDDNDCLTAFETKVRKNARSRSLSTMELIDNHIITDNLYAKSFQLFRTVDQFLTFAKGKPVK